MNIRGPSPKNLFQVWAVLLGLLFFTWLVARFNLGMWNTVAAMSIAVVKMLLVVLIFMHVRYSARLVWVFAAAGLFWLFIMVSLMMSDYLTRDLTIFH
jgi:cytochrome c oxidase subunit IV